jgi:branched-chain amino acid transport system substrate-binding protein
MAKLRAILVLGIFIGLLVTPLTYAADPPIKMGTVLRLSIGAEHGINGRQVELIVEDEKDSPAASVNAVQKLINVDKVIGMVGPMTSGDVMAATKIADEAKVVIITPTATTPKLSGAAAYVYRGCSRIDT